MSAVGLKRYLDYVPLLILIALHAFGETRFAPQVENCLWDAVGRAERKE